MTEPILTVRGLRANAGEDLLLKGVDLVVPPGTVLAVVGQSGAGKTTLGRALQGESSPGVTLSGSVELHGTELLGCTDPQRRRARAGRTSLLPQHPAGVLNPMRRIGKTLRELAALRHSSRVEQKETLREVLVAVRLEPTQGFLRRFPHQLSGGQQQRLALAQALITKPGIVTLDEPTTGADTVTKSETADMLENLAGNGTALVLLTHDLPLARRLAHDAVVLHDGEVAEHGPGTRPLYTPRHALTREILAAEPHLVTESEAVQDRSNIVLRAEAISHRAKDGTPLLTDVDLSIRSGWCTAIVGPSGAGKTTLARCLAGLTRPATGRIRLGGVWLALSAWQRSREHRRHVQYVHQDARAAFDQRKSVIRQVARTAERLRDVSRHHALREAEDMLAMLGLESTQTGQCPTQLSGGQLQRAALARALLARPTVLICDEVTSALDVINQAELFRALTAVKSTMDVSIVLISHDFAVVSAFADELHLLDAGRVVESASPQNLLVDPQSELATRLVTAARKHHRAGAANLPVD